MYNTEKLEVRDKISFILADMIFDGVIIDKEILERDEVSFIIKLDNNKIMRLKNKNLDLYCKYD